MVQIDGRCSDRPSQAPARFSASAGTTGHGAHATRSPSTPRIFRDDSRPIRGAEYAPTPARRHRVSARPAGRVRPRVLRLAAAATATPRGRCPSRRGDRRCFHCRSATHSGRRPGPATYYGRLNFRSTGEARSRKHPHRAPEKPHVAKILRRTDRGEVRETKNMSRAPVCRRAVTVGTDEFPIAKTYTSTTVAERERVRVLFGVREYFAFVCPSVASPNTFLLPLTLYSHHSREPF